MDGSPVMVIRREGTHVGGDGARRSVQQQIEWDEYQQYGVEHRFRPARTGRPW
jgi:hypothetical protein